MPQLPSSKQHVLELLTSKSMTHPICECYCYQGYVTPNGYGSIQLPEGKFLIHRLSAWIHLDFDLSSKLQVNHKIICMNRNCWNPNHLYIGTQQENMHDRFMIGTHNNERKTHCKRGHPFDEKNTRINGKGARVCIECDRIYQRNKYQQQKQKEA